MKKRILINLLLFLCTITYGQKAIFLYHSTGIGVFSQGKVANWISDYNSTNGTDHQVDRRSYPKDPYPWANYPYDWWNL